MILLAFKKRRNFMVDPDKEPVDYISLADTHYLRSFLYFETLDNNHAICIIMYLHHDRHILSL